MSVDHLQIYKSQAERYEALVSREDYQSRIWQTLQDICDWQGQTVLDLGAGTGRLMKLLLSTAGFVCGFDRSPTMLAVAHKTLAQSGLRNWGLSLADHSQLPLSDNAADRIISGWSLAYLALEQAPHWQEYTAAAFERMFEILRPGGRFIILETMGTGFSQPHPPEELLDYYAFLEALGFQSSWIRTDYQFATVAEAESLTRFFFGDELADEVKAKQWTILPECTGVWWI